MEKSKKADSKKGNNASAKNEMEKKAKQSPKTNNKSNEKMDYPLWTMPEYLNDKDHKELKRVFELYKENKFELALNYASDLDTIVRDEIPLDIWKEIGGSLTSSGEEELKSNEENQETIENVEVKEEVILGKIEVLNGSIDFQNQHVLLNGKLFVPKGDYFVGGEKIDEAKFHTKSDLEDFIIQNYKTLFGENTIIIDNTKSRNEYFPDMFLFDFQDKEKPRMYIIESNLTDDNLGLLYARITHFIASIKNKVYQNDFLTKLCNAIYASDKAKDDLGIWLTEEQELTAFLSGLLENKPAILLIKDNNNVVLDLMQTVYVETWGKMLRQILVKKFYCNDDKIYSVNPLFVDIWRNGKQKKEEIIKVSENDHLCELPDRIRSIYKSIKTSLLEMDSSLEFNPKKHYISIRKNKNLAFIHLRRKQVDIVVMNPADNTRELIKHYKIKTLPASVQKFWNGECCTIVVENSDSLDEVIDLLKMVVGKV